MKTKVLLSALLAQLFTLSASAYNVYIDGIYYNLDATTKTATVTYRSYQTTTSSYKYSGRISIPTVVNYNNVNYKVTTIGNSAFYNNDDVTYVSIPSSVTSIEEDAFYDCDYITSMTIPASVKTIGYRAFCSCNRLATIDIPASISFIENDAFASTPWRTSWLGNQPDGPCYIGSVLYAYKGTMPEDTNVVVNDGTTCIAGGAFYGQTNLVSIEIPETVTSVGSLAFRGTGLKTITFPSSLTYLGVGALLKCTSLTSVEVPFFTKSGGKASYSSTISSNSWSDISSGIICAGCTGLTSASFEEGTKEVYAGMFADCTSLEAVTLPSTTTSISQDAFRNCDNLSLVTAKMPEPIAIGSELFTNRFLSTLIVPDGCKAAYEAAEFWQDFMEIKEESETDPANKCAKPTISYANGTLTFNSETEGATFFSTITDADIKSYSVNEVQLGVTYNVSVYATKEGFGNSEVATATLCWVELQPQTEGIIKGDAVAEVKSVPVLIQSEGGTITVQGVVDDSEVSVYSVNGMLQASSVAYKGTATLNTSLQPGSVVIVKIGDKSVKVLMK